MSSKRIRKCCYKNLRTSVINWIFSLEWYALVHPWGSCSFSRSGFYSSAGAKILYNLLYSFFRLPVMLREIVITPSASIKDTYDLCVHPVYTPIICLSVMRSSVQMTNDRLIHRLNYQWQASILFIDQWKTSMTSFL